MAIRFLHRARPALVVCALAASTAVVPNVAFATPSPRQEPSADDVQQKLGKLALQNSQLVERYDYARVMVGKRDAAADAARKQAQSAKRQYYAATVAFAQNAQASYAAGSMGATGALFDSESGGNYLDRLDTLSMISSYDADVVERLEATRKAADSDAARASRLLSAAKRERDGIAEKKDEVTEQISKYRTLLATLNAEQRSAYAEKSNPGVDVKKLKDLPGGASGKAKKAVEFALKQVGKPYVFGAEGPGSYDCSGLTKMAWNAGGVSLPHSAADQYNHGTHVGLDSLSPGDLIFMYKPIGHVTIYIGDGYMVSAPTEGQDVTVIPVSHSADDIVGATHIG